MPVTTLLSDRTETTVSSSSVSDFEQTVLSTLTQFNFLFNSFRHRNVSSFTTNFSKVLTDIHLYTLPKVSRVYSIF